jgi:hypothetical protein
MLHTSKPARSISWLQDHVEEIRPSSL